MGYVPPPPLVPAEVAKLLVDVESVLDARRASNTFYILSCRGGTEEYISYHWQNFLVPNDIICPYCFYQSSI